jgi:hypothetical protein
VNRFLLENKEPAPLIALKLAFLVCLFAGTKLLVPKSKDNPEAIRALAAANEIMEKRREQPTSNPQKWESAFAEEYLGGTFIKLGGRVVKNEQEWVDDKGGMRIRFPCHFRRDDLCAINGHTPIQRLRQVSHSSRTRDARFLRGVLLLLAQR